MLLWAAEMVAQDPILGATPPTMGALRRYLDPTDEIQRGAVPWIPSLAGGLLEARATQRPMLILASDEVFGST